MLSLVGASVTSFSTLNLGHASGVAVRSVPLVMQSSVDDTVAGTTADSLTTNADGVVVPTGSGTSATPAAPRAHAWNPNGLTIDPIPSELKLFKDQFVPDYLKVSPAYLDGSMPGDIGFDPWCLVALAKPDWYAREALDKTSRTAADRNERLLAMPPEEQQANLEWMRASELKHARLAMLAVIGWTWSELINGGFPLHGALAATNGRAPSLFNGQLLENLPFVALVFGGLAYLESQTSATVKDGDYGWDPLSLSNPSASPIPFGELPFKVPNVGDVEALKLAEIKNGRLAMMAITGFAVQECLYGTPVVEQTGIFFMKF